jgi:hypothetical protein
MLVLDKDTDKDTDMDTDASPLSGFPLVVWINMERCTERRGNMEQLLDGLGLRHRRVRGIDGADPADASRVRRSPSGGACDNACTASHVEAMRCFLEDTDEPGVVVAEDDLSFEYLPFWRRGWTEYLAAAPAGCEILQLCVMLANRRDVARLDPGRPVLRPSHNWFSTCAYYVSREAARRIVDRCTAADGVVDLLDAAGGGSCHPDILLYSLACTYTLPLLTYTCADSTFHADHLASHQACKDVVKAFWEPVAS